jgi:cytidine deaminase
MMFDL